jgi:hypothetical protein
MPARTMMAKEDTEAPAEETITYNDLEDVNQDLKEVNQDLEDTHQDLEEPTNSEKRAQVFKKGATLATGMVHPKLAELPTSTGLSIAVVIVIVNILFVVFLTLYSVVFNCQQKLGVVDADWQETGEFKPYSEHFKAPTYLCASLLLDDAGVYTIPCVLDGLTCESYIHGRCPEIGYSFVYDACDSIEPCLNNESSALASVLYAECTSFTVAFGSSMGYVTYTQLLLLVVFFGTYLLWKKCTGSGDVKIVDSLKDVVSSHLSK